MNYLIIFVAFLLTNFYFVIMCYYNNTMEKINDIKINNLFKAIMSLRTLKEARAFFRDLCTIEEIRDLSERWEIAQLVEQKMPYRDIAKELNVSTTTVSRVAFWLNNGENGYKIALKKLNLHHRGNSSGKGLR